MGSSEFPGGDSPRLHTWIKPWTDGKVISTAEHSLRINPP